MLATSWRGSPIIINTSPEEATKRASRELWHDGVGAFFGEPPPITTTSTPTLYVQSEAVRAAVEAYANLVASTAFLLHQEDRTGELQEVKTHDALAVLENPNEFMTRFELFGLTISDLLLSGNAYWFLASPRTGGSPSEIWRLNPRFTRIVRSKEKFISGYVTEIDSVMIPLERVEVIHFKLINPVYADEFYGLSKLATAAMAAHSAYGMEKWNSGMFGRDYAIPAGLVAFKSMVSDSVFEQAKAEWRASYGSGSGRKTGFIRGGEVSFMPIGLNQTDVDFLGGSKWQAEKIYRVFGTYQLLPAQFADDRKVNERLFLENHAWPLLIYLSEILTDQYLTFWGQRRGSGRLVGAFEDVRPRERALDLSEDQEDAKGLTFNEWRIKRKLEEVDGGDDILFVHVQAGEMVQFERDAMPEPPPQLAPFTEPGNEPPQPPGEKKPESEAVKPEDDQEKAERRESANDDTGDDIGESTNKAIDLHRELKTWRKFELRKLDQGHTRLFKVEAIPPALALIIQAAVDDCDDGEAVKGVFARIGDLVDGRVEVTPAAKSSFGVPDAAVVLYLSGIEDVLRVQQSLMRSVPSDAPFRWTPAEQLHITLVQCPMVDELDYRTISQETGPFNAINIRVTEIATFDVQNGAIPIVALVELSDELKALQADVWGDFAAHGIAVSEYSNPDMWKPHITLGYAEYVEFSGLNYGPYYEFGCTADTLSFTRGSFENLYSRVAAPVLIEMPAYDEMAMATIKAIQATRLLFEVDFESVLSAARSGDIDRRAWANRMRTLLRKYGEMAYRDGLADGGIIYGPDEPLDPDDRAALNGMLATQSGYVTELGRVLFRTETGISDGAAGIKPTLWFNKSILPLYQAGLLSADSNSLYSWSFNPLKRNCVSCLSASEQVHRLKDWERYDLRPNSPVLACGGWLCGCRQQRTTGRAKGRLSSIPLGAIKAEQHEHEDMPMITTWPDGLPDDIKAEFNRVLRKQIQSCELADNGQYNMTLREEAGYYASVANDDEAQRGLTMIDERLKLVSFEMIDDTDMRVMFTVGSADHASSDTDES